MITIVDAQADMRRAYYDGFPGVFSSGLIWIAAGLAAMLVSSTAGMLTLIFAGTLIFPLSVLLCKAFGRTGKHQADNPLASLAIEGTIWMLLSIPVAVLASFYKIELFFPAMLLVIAGRYLTFNTLYGMRIFWLLSALLVASALGLVFLSAPVISGAFCGGIIEMCFALLLFSRSKTRNALDENTSRV